MKTIEETFKAEKEIYEDFFKNTKINEICKNSLTIREEEYNIRYYIGKIKNSQKLNVKNSFDLLEYLKPCFVYIASDIKTIKEEIKKKKEHAYDLAMYLNYYSYISINLPNIDTYYYYYCHRLFVGFGDCSFKKKIFFQRFFKW